MENKKITEVDITSAIYETDHPTFFAERLGAFKRVTLQKMRALLGITALQSAVGGPLVAATAAGMTDQTKVYVYTGSETGYTAGNWYYHNGTSWTSGGVYNSTAVATDTTLSVSGKAADAKAVGDALGAVPGLTNDVKNALLSCFKNVSWDTQQSEALYQDLFDALDPQPNSITAVFTQGDVIIYTTDSLDTLEQYLVITASYADGSTKAITNYVLSGTLTAGTSTITATYRGLTDTFTVAVTAGT